MESCAFWLTWLEMNDVNTAWLIHSLDVGEENVALRLLQVNPEIRLDLSSRWEQLFSHVVTNIL